MVDEKCVFIRNIKGGEYKTNTSVASRWGFFVKFVAPAYFTLLNFVYCVLFIFTYLIFQWSDVSRSQTNGTNNKKYVGTNRQVKLSVCLPVYMSVRSSWHVGDHFSLTTRPIFLIIFCLIGNHKIYSFFKYFFSIDR